MVYFGYKSITTPKIKLSQQQILSFSLSVELFQSACLIHDDIMDNAKTRRGELTVQEFFKNYNSYKTSDLAKNLAILAGDLALIWADELFWSSGIDPRVLIKVKPCFDQLRQEVIFGQTLDLLLSSHCEESCAIRCGTTRQSASPKKRLPRSLRSLAMTESDILKMYEYKTARYSFVRPLQLGAKLAGASANELKILNDYATPVGIAFQIQDDILGTFGKNSGKDSDSDIKEGKETLLIHISKIKNQKSKIKNKLEKILGNRNASEKDIEWVRNLIKESGALKYCQNLAEKLVRQGKNSLKNTFVSPETKKFLIWLADFCLAREK